MELCPFIRAAQEGPEEMKKPSITIRMSPEMIGKLKGEADALNISFSQVIVEILTAQLNGEKFSKLDFLIRKTFRGPTVGQ